MAAVPCKFETIFGFGYNCRVNSQTIKQGPVTLSGAHESGKSNDRVTSLNINNCDMPVFPRNLQYLFPNLDKLEVENCTLESIGREHIGKWTNLQNIYINGCKVKCLKGDTFSGLTELSTIVFANNQLEEIEPDILDGLEKLNYVNFEGNPHIDLNVERTAIREIKRAIKLVSKEQNVKKLERQIAKLVAENAELKLFKENHEKSECQQTQQSRDGMKFKELQHVLIDETFKDFTINIGDSSFKVHKLIFAAHSQTLAELFRNNPQAQELNLRDIPESTFKAIYDFIYTDQLSADANFLEVFKAAARLKIEDLKEAAAAHLIDTLDDSNSYEVFVLSNKFEHEELRNKAFENIRTKVFPDRKLDDKLVNDPEKLKKLIEAKRRLDMEFASI